jgi:hypothetical protein
MKQKANIVLLNSLIGPTYLGSRSMGTSELGDERTDDDEGRSGEEFGS